MQLECVIQLNNNTVAFPLSSRKLKKIKIITTANLTINNLSNGTTVLLATSAYQSDLEDLEIGPYNTFTTTGTATVFCYS